MLPLRKLYTHSGSKGGRALSKRHAKAVKCLQHLAWQHLRFCPASIQVIIFTSDSCKAAAAL
jgi:hypothetical protein